MINKTYIFAFIILTTLVVFVCFDKNEDALSHLTEMIIVNKISNDDIHANPTNKNATNSKRGALTINKPVTDDIYSENEEFYRNFITHLNDSESSSLSSFLDKSLLYPEYLDENVRAFRHAIINSNFNEIKELVNFFVGTELEHDSIDSALDVAIVRGNVELVQYLTNIGGKIKSSHINSILSSQDSKFLESLENIGIELYSVDSSGEDEISPLSYLIYININTDTEYSKNFEKLLLAGYNVNAKSNGVDPLFLSIRYLDESNYKHALSYTRKLIDNGASITNRHLAMMKKLSKSHPQLYKETVELLPQLGINRNSYTGP